MKKSQSKKGLESFKKGCNMNTLQTIKGGATATEYIILLFVPITNFPLENIGIAKP